jgi:P pilus assembly chaperone PapD
VTVRFWLLLFIFACALLLTSSGAQAERGVGVNLAEIRVDENLAPGGSYKLPSVGVINTGDESGAFEVSVIYLEGQTDARPPATWFQIQPAQFRLGPGETQQVDVRVVLPTGATEGKYFAYLEAHPVTNDAGVSVNVAAATKLSFTVAAASWLDAQRTRINRWLDENQKWLLLGGVALLAIIAFKNRDRIPFEIRRKA